MSVRQQHRYEHQGPAGSDAPNAMRDPEPEHIPIGSGAECRQFGMIVAAIEAHLLERRALPDECEQDHRCRRPDGRQCRGIRHQLHREHENARDQPDRAVADREQGDRPGPPMLEAALMDMEHRRDQRRCHHGDQHQHPVHRQRGERRDRQKRAKGRPGPFRPHATTIRQAHFTPGGSQKHHPAHGAQQHQTAGHPPALPLACRHSCVSR